MPGAPAKARIARFQPERARERDLLHVERASHDRVVDLALPNIDQPPRALGLVVNHSG